MQQTLFALLALLIATLLSFNQKQTAVQSQAQVMRAEMEQMALAVAAQSAQVIRSRAYGDATAGVPSDSLVPTSEFTDPSSFPSGNDCTAFGGSDTCDDVDDFDEMVTATVPFTFPSGTFDFSVDVNVRYVDSNLDPITSVSDRKQIVVTVQDDPASGEPRLPEPISYSEVVAYP